MLRDMIDILKAAKELGDEDAIKRAYKNLSRIGIDKTSADIILKDLEEFGSEEAATE